MADTWDAYVRSVGREEYEMSAHPCPADCMMCSGEYCERHQYDPCECDVLDRHWERRSGRFRRRGRSWLHELYFKLAYVDDQRKAERRKVTQ